MKVKRKKRLELGSLPFSFGYNDRSELSSASLGASPYAYDYDNIGNRKTAQEITEEISYDANNINQYCSITHGETPFVPLFDADGNQSLVQSSTGIWALSYNAESRPISFTKIEAEQTTIIECGYDYMGRRYMKKVSVNGLITLHHRYLYRGYLQIACVDLTRNGHPALWLTMWNPSEPVATRPLAIQKNATWYSYGHDLTKNITELYHTNGTIASSYDYTPFGAVTATGTEQPYQWSSEYHDTELGLVYYNYRHYNPRDGRWINRDPIAEQGGLNLYGFVGNNAILGIDYLGETPPKDKCPSASSGRLKPHPSRNVNWRMYRTKEQNSDKIEVNGCGSSDGIKFQEQFSYSGGKISFSFKESCNNHDKCYSQCGSSKKDCDTKFYNDMNKVCETSANDPFYVHTYTQCRDRRDKYYWAVKVAGRMAYEGAQDKHCIWEQCCLRMPSFG